MVGHTHEIAASITTDATSAPVMIMSSKAVLEDNNSNSNSHISSFSIHSNNKNLGHSSPTLVPSSTPSPALSATKGEETRAPGIAFALTRQDAEASDHVLKGTISISSVPSRCVSNSRSSYSFLSPSFASKLEVNPIIMDIILSIETPLERS